MIGFSQSLNVYFHPHAFGVFIRTYARFYASYGFFTFTVFSLLHLCILHTYVFWVFSTSMRFVLAFVY